MKDLISIIIPVYNCEKYLSKCLDSLINQTYENLEIILINDGSTDNSIELCNEYKKKDARIKVFSKENSGPSLTRKFGFEKSTGNYIMFIDSDDWMDLDMCEYLVNLQKTNKADVVCCSYYINDDSFETEERIIELKDKEIIEDYLYRNNIKSCCWNKLYKKKVISPQYFHPIYKHGEDVLFVCNVLLGCNKVVCTNMEKYHYNVSNNSITRSKVSHKKIEDNYLSHQSQIKLIKSKYKNNFELQSKANEKLFDSLLNLYVDMTHENEKNEEEKYLISLIRESYKKYGKKTNLSKNKKIKLILISKFNFLIKGLYKIKNEKLLIFIYLLAAISVVVLTGFPIFLERYNQEKINTIYSEIVNFVNSDNNTNSYLATDLGYEVIDYSEDNQDIELVVFKDGYCATKIRNNSNVNVFATAKSNCLADNSPEIKYFSGTNIEIMNIVNPKIRNYIIYGESTQDKVTKNTQLVEEKKEKTNIIELKLETKNTKDIFKINLTGYERLKKINNIADYIDYREQKIVRKIGKYTLNGTEEIKKIRTSSKKYNTYVVTSERFDKSLYLTLLKREYKNVDAIYEAVKDAKKQNRDLNIYYLLEEDVIEYVSLPQLDLYIEDNYVSVKSDNQLSLLVYSQS